MSRRLIPLLVAVIVAGLAAVVPAVPASASDSTASVDISSGEVTTFAGDGTNATLDGTGTAARLRGPRGAAIVGTNAYVGSTGSIRKVDLTTGAVTILAGHASSTGCDNSTTASSVRFNTIYDVATDGTDLYISGDCSGMQVRKISIATGATTTLNGLDRANYLTVQGGYVYVTRGSGGTLAKIDKATGTATTFASFGNAPYGIASDADYLWVATYASTSSQKIEKVSLATGTVTTLVNTTSIGTNTLVSAGDYLYADAGVDSTIVRRYSKSTGTGLDIAGSTSGGFVDATGASARFSSILGLGSDGSEYLYATDTGNHRLRRIRQAPAPVPPTPAAYKAALLADSPYAYLPLDEDNAGTAAADASGNSRNGTYHGTLTPGTTGPWGSTSRAMTFGGEGQYVSLDSALVPATGDWTVEAFVKTLGSGFGDGDPIWSQYANNYNTRTSAQACGTGSSPRCVGVQIGDDGTWPPNQLADNRWAHVVWRRAGTTVTVLVNGRAIASFTTAGSVDSKATWIGGQSLGGSSTAYFNGKISQFAVYRTALTDGQIRAHLEASPPVEGGLQNTATYGGGSPDINARPCQAGDPIDPATGNFYETFTDLAVAGRGVPLNFSRTYNASLAGSNGPLGYGWSHTYGAAVSTTATTATVTHGNGSATTFTLAGTSYSAPPHVMATLVKHVDGTWTYTRRAREIFTFDATGRPTAQKDLNGNTTAITYPSSTSTVVTDPAGRTLTMTLSGGRITSVADSSSPARTVSFSYDGSGNLTDVVTVTGGHWTFTYDSAHRMLTKRSPRYYGDTTTSPSPVVTNHYDSAGRVDLQTDQLGRQTSFDYTTVPGSTKVTDPKSNVTLYSYRDGMLASLTEGYGTARAATTSYGHDPFTLGCTTVTDPKGHETTSTYDGAGNLVSTKDPLGRTTSATYNVLGLPLTVTDAAGVTTTMTYDGAGNPLTQSRPLLDGSGATVATATTTYTHGDSAHPEDVTSLTDPTNRTWTNTYDSAGNLTSVKDPATPENSSGNKTTHTYNATTGLRTATVAPKGNLTGATPADYTATFLYDAAGRPTETRDPLWSSSTPTQHRSVRHYDADGNLDSSTDGNNRQTSFTYNPAGELTVTTRPDSTTLQQTYWADGRLKDQLDGAGQATTYGYDELGRVTTVTDPLNRTTTHAYDLAGNRVSTQSPGGNCGATPKTGCMTMSYDDGDQLTAITYSDGTTPNVTGITYDANGRRTAMTDGTGTSTWTFDSLGRMTSSVDGAGGTVAYGYDLAGRSTTVTHPGSKTVTNGYDGAGRMNAVTDWLSNATGFAYDANSNLITQTLPSGTGVVDTTTFDRADRLTGISIEQGASTLASFTYGRDGADLLSAVTSTGVPTDTHAYGYTARSQLQDVDATAYAYDAADNLTTLAAGGNQGFDVANQLCWSTTTAATGSCTSAPTGATTYGYDARGNRTSVTPSGGSATTLAYDQANRLTAYGSGATYAYNGDGLRMSKSVSSVAKAFVWDVSGGLPMLLKDGTTHFVYGPGGVPLEQVDGSGTVTWLHHDQLGSTRLLTNGSGSVVGSKTYDAYGNATGSTGAVSTVLGFAGQYTDAESGYQYLRARYYDPATGQFLTRDSWGAQTREPYSYAGGSPLNYTDPAGLAPVNHQYKATPRPPGMSDRDWQSYLTVVGQMNAKNCAAQRGWAAAEKQRAYEARWADQVFWQKSAIAFKYSAPDFGDNLRASLVIKDPVGAVYSGFGCAAGIAPGAAAGAYAGARGGPWVAAGGAVIGGLAGCGVGAAEAYYTSSPMRAP